MRRHKMAAALVLALIMAPVTFAQEQAISMTEKATFWGEVKALVPTHLVFPSNFDSTETHSLILAIHGFGATAEGFMRISEPFTKAGFLFAAPETAYSVYLGNENVGREWFLYEPPARVFTELQMRALRLVAENQLPSVVNDLRHRYRIDKVYVLGFSQGGIVTYLSGIHNKELIDGMIVFGALLDEVWLGNDSLAQGHDESVLILHGEADEPVPIAEAERTRDLLIENGYDVTFRRFEGGHTVPQDLLDFVVKWIQEDTVSGQ